MDHSRTLKLDGLDLDKYGKYFSSSKLCFTVKKADSIGMGNCFSLLTERFATSPVEEGVKVFTMVELKKATKNFGKERVIGDSYGEVVRGYINPKTLSPAKEGVGMAVAVKRFYLKYEEALQKCLVDLEILRHNSHPSLVKLIGYGYGYDHEKLFIVSEYFPNGSLERYIFRKSRPKSLPWETRLKISIEGARCLAFLHSRKKDGLYRTCLTACNILLDSEFNARVSCFRLKMVDSLEDCSHTPSYADGSSRIYYAPLEYIFSGISHMAGDVYSFGVILLEILTGLRNPCIILAKQATQNGKENIAEMIDPDLENSYPLAAGKLMCELSKQCLEDNPKIRPTMQEVLDNLNAIGQI
ncbi:unnamed protein product [Arabidopsis lyrata]|nr:unnamed protein product [Arabidopsis lyrata]